MPHFKFIFKISTLTIPLAINPCVAAFTSSVSGTVTGQTVNNGVQTINSGGKALNGTITTGGGQVVKSGGQTDRMTINNGGWQDVLPGGLAENTTINNGEQRADEGGTINNSIVGSSGKLTVYGQANSTRVLSGGRLILNGDGKLADTTVENNGRLTVGGSRSTIEGTTTINGTGIISIANTLTNTGNLVLNQTTGQTIDGRITGTGSVTKNGSNVLILTGQNDYTGGTTVTAGVLQGDTNSLQGDIQNDALLVFNQTTDGSYSGQLSGNGILEKTGGATLTLDADAQTGTLNHNQGTLIIAQDKQLTANTVNIDAGTVLGIAVSNRPAVVANTVNFTNSSTVDISGYDPVNDIGTYNLIQAAGGINGNPAVTVGGVPIHTFVNLDTYLIGSSYKDNTGKKLIAKLTLVWNNSANSNAHGTFNIKAGKSFDVGVVLEDKSGAALGFGWDGTTLTKTGEGTLILDSTNTYTGLTDIQTGKIIVGSTVGHSNASIAGNVNVALGATLGGHGQILGDVRLLNGSTISPGNSIGTITVGNITFDSNATYEFEANEDGSADKINATGAATIHGGRVHVLAGGNIWKTTSIYTILTAAGGVLGTYDGLTSNLAFLEGKLSYDADNVYLKLERNEIGMGSLGGSTYNQSSTGRGIESLRAGNAIYDRIVSMDKLTALNSFDNLSGEIHASAHSALLSNSRYVRAAVNQHLYNQSPEPGKNLWGHVWGHDGHIKGNSNAERISNKGAGILFGLDMPINETTKMGIAAGYEQTKLKIRSTRQSQADVDAYHIMLYGQTQAGPINLRGGIGYAKLDTDTQRDITVTGLQGQNKASYGGHQLQAFIEGSYTHVFTETAQVTPYLNLSHVQVKSNDFTERGNITALLGHGNTNHITTTTLGVRGEMKVGGQKQHHLYADLGVQARSGDKTPAVDLNFIAGRSYDVKGASIGTSSAIVGLGANWQLKPNMNLNVGYEGEFGSKARDNSIKAKLQWIF